jgi:hypothetical protein
MLGSACPIEIVITFGRSSISAEKFRTSAPLTCFSEARTGPVTFVVTVAPSGSASVRSMPSAVGEFSNSIRPAVGSTRAPGAPLKNEAIRSVSSPGLCWVMSMSSAGSPLGEISEARLSDALKTCGARSPSWS